MSYIVIQLTRIMTNPKFLYLQNLIGKLMQYRIKNFGLSKKYINPELRSMYFAYVKRAYRPMLYYNKIIQLIFVFKVP